MTDLLFVSMPIIAAILISSFGVFLLFLGSNTYVKAVLLRRDGVAGVAVITRRYQKKVYVHPKERHGTTARYTNHFNYKIRHNGKTYEIKGKRPSQSLWDRVAVGSDVDVIYLPRNPKNSQLAETYAHAGTVGGVIQMIAGTVMTTGGVVFVLGGLWAAAMPFEQRVAGADWVRDRGLVLWIAKSDNAFVRIVRPKTRQVHFEIGDDDGGREYLGQVDIMLGPNQFPELRVGDWVDVFRAPDDKNQAVLQTLY